MSSEKHTVELVKPCLEIDEHLALQEKGWIAQRIGWVIILGIMVAGLSGLFGEGLLSKQSQSSGRSKAEYERFFRYEAEMKVLVQSANPVSSISLPEEYLKRFRVVRFIPESSNNTTTGNSVSYNFTSSENHTISIYLMPKSYGTISGTMKINEQDNIYLNHFIYP